MHKGKITITQPQKSFKRNNYIVIVVRDASNSKDVVTIEIDAKDFGMAVTGSNFVPCGFKLKNIEAIGKRLETKTENVPRPKKNNKTEEDKVLLPYETDGWKADRKDFHNHFRRMSQNRSRVCFRRYVYETEEEKVDP